MQRQMLRMPHHFRRQPRSLQRLQPLNLLASSLWAVRLLVGIHALDEREEPTALGLHLSSLPLDVVVGKTLIYGAMFGCIEPVLTIAAALGEKSPFLCPFEARDEANAAHAKFAASRSDLIALAKAFETWEALRHSSGNAAARSWAVSSFISDQSLFNIAATRKKLRALLREMGFTGHAAVLNANADNTRVLRAVICAGLYPRLARVVLPPPTYTEVGAGAFMSESTDPKLVKIYTQTERVFIHPASLLFGATRWGTGAQFIAYFEKFKTAKVFLRDATVVSPYALMLFGGQIRVHHESSRLTIDGWLALKSPAKASVLFAELRREMDRLLQLKVEDPRTEIACSPAVRGIVELLTAEPGAI
eukprot:c21694_g1_i1.p1 GENE.c21694_g1_i1~~c21694_g1_i1.p1  ORF type:complete len:362 (+),score=72.31 c21694_g1_i1:159-1244(+)